MMDSDSCRALIRLYSPNIEEVLVVDDVLGCFPEWKQDLVEKIRSLPTRTEQAREFLSCLHCVEDEAPFSVRFTQFLDALTHANYQPLSRLLRGESTKKFDTYLRTLKILQPEIAKCLVIDLPLLRELLARDVITEEEKEQIWSLVGHGNSRQGLDILMRSLPRRQEDWPDEFVEALQRTGNQRVLAIIFDIADDDDDAFDPERIHKKNEELMTSVLPDCFRSTGDGMEHDSSCSENESLPDDREPQTCAKTVNVNNLSPGQSLEAPEDNISSGQSSDMPDTDSASSQPQASFNLNFESISEETVAATALRPGSFDSSCMPSSNSTPGKSKMYEKDLQFQIKTGDMQRLCSTEDESREYLDVDSGPMAMSSPLQPPTIPGTNKGQGHRDHSRDNGDNQQSQVHTCLPESSRPPQYSRQSHERPNTPNLSQNPENSMQAHESVSLGQNLGNIDQAQVTQYLTQQLGSMSLQDQGIAESYQEQHSQSNIQQMSVCPTAQNPYNYTPAISTGQIQGRPTVPKQLRSMPLQDQDIAQRYQERHSQSNIQQMSDYPTVQNQFQNPHNYTPAITTGQIQGRPTVPQQSVSIPLQDQGTPQLDHEHHSQSNFQQMSAQSTVQNQFQNPQNYTPGQIQGRSTVTVPQQCVSMPLSAQSTPQCDLELHSQYIQQMSDRSTLQNQFQNPQNYTPGQIQGRSTVPQQCVSMPLPAQSTPQCDQEQHSQYVQQMSDRSTVQNQFQNPHNYTPAITTGQIQGRPTMPQQLRSMPLLDQGTPQGEQEHSQSNARQILAPSNVQNQLQNHPPSYEEVCGTDDAMATGQMFRCSAPPSNMRHQAQSWNYPSSQNYRSSAPPLDMSQHGHMPENYPSSANTPTANRQKKAQVRPRDGPSPAPPKTVSLPVNPAAVWMPRPNSQKEKIKQVYKPKKESLPRAVYPARGSFDAENTPVQARGSRPTPKPKKDEKVFIAAANKDRGSSATERIPKQARGNTPKPQKDCLPSAPASNNASGVGVQGKNRSLKAPDLDMGVWTVDRLPKQPGRKPSCTGCKEKVFNAGDLGIKVKGRQEIIQKDGKSAIVVRSFRFCPVTSCLHNLRDKVILTPPKALEVPSDIQLTTTEMDTLARLGLPLGKK